MARIPIIMLVAAVIGGGIPPCTEALMLYAALYLFDGEEEPEYGMQLAL